MTESERDRVHPLQVVDEHDRRPEPVERTVRRLEDAQRLQRRLRGTAGGEEQLLELSASRCGRERAEQARGGREGDARLGLVAEDLELVRNADAVPRFCKQPALPATRIARYNGRGYVAGERRGRDAAKHAELVVTSDEHGHVLKRTT